MAIATYRGRAMRSPTTASASPVRTSPTPNTVCSSAKVSSDASSTSRTYSGSSTPNTAHNAYTQLATANVQRRPEVRRARVKPFAQLAPRRGGVGFGIARHRFDPDPERHEGTDEKGRGVGDERALEPPPRVHQRGCDRTDDDRDVLRATEQRIRGDQLRVRDDPWRHRVERCRRQRLDQSERERQHDDHRVAVGLRERERVDDSEHVRDQEGTAGSEPVDGHTEEWAQQRARGSTAPRTGARDRPRRRRSGTTRTPRWR